MKEKEQVSAFVLIVFAVITNNTALTSIVTCIFHGIGLIAFATVGTENVLLLSEKTSTDERTSTTLTHETVVVPVSIFEGNVARTTDTSNWFTTCITFLREKTSETICTIRLFVAGCKSLASQGTLTICTCKTFAMPWLVFVGYTTLGNHFFTTSALRREMIFIARNAIALLIFGNKTFDANRL